MDQDNQNSNSINFAPNDPAYAPVNGPEPAVSASINLTGAPAQPTSVSDQINVFGQAQQAAAGLDMAPVSTEAPVPATPQFAQPALSQPIETMPMVPPVAPAAASTQPIASVQPPAFQSVVAPIEVSTAQPISANLEPPVSESIPSLTQTPSLDPSVASPADSAAATGPSTNNKKSSFISLLLLIGVFVLLFGLALLIGYSLGFKAGQASMPGM